MAKKLNVDQPIGFKLPPMSNISKSAGTFKPESAPQARTALVPPITQPPSNFDPNCMTIPKDMLNCPPGLQYLSTLDQLLIEENIDLDQHRANDTKYFIRNAMGQQLYGAIEEKYFCLNNCYIGICRIDVFRWDRPFRMCILDIHQREVIHFHRLFRCTSCWCFCCLQVLEVSASGENCGSVEQEWTLWYPNYRLKNHLGETVLRIEGPFCTSSCFNDLNFKIISLDGTEVGVISKHWAGFWREVLTDADFYGISFPVDLDVRMKAVLIGACILIDAMFFEDNCIC